MSAKVYNIPYGAPFLEKIAKRFLSEYQQNPLELADVLFLMPNRRSCLSLKEAFLRINGLAPFLLPEIVPVQETNEDEIFFQNNDEPSLLDLPAAISNKERLFLFAKLIASKHSEYGINDISYAQSLALARDLGKLIDETYNQNLSFDKLEEIVPSQYAAHWQETLTFLRIVTSYWPQILKERNMIDAVDKRNLLLSAQADLWQKTNTGRRIVAVGLNPAFESLKKVLKTISNLPHGEIFLYGLDKDMPNETWEILSPTHPQFAKKEILDLLKIDRTEVVDLEKTENKAREKLVSEMMREARTTDAWCEIDEAFMKEGAKDLHLMEARDNFEEALMIALLMRKTLETPEKTAALVTTDRNLAREVSAVLNRFGIQIDDSAGIPLHLTPVGIYLRQISDVLTNDFSASSVAALLKNPYTHLKRKTAEIRHLVRQAEFERRMPTYNAPANTAKQDALLKELNDAYEPLLALYQMKKAPLKKLMEAHIRVAQSLAETDVETGSNLLWRHEDGRLCAALLAELIDKADTAGDICVAEYASALTILLSSETVRKPYGSHPRLKILGPIEARFNRFDVMIAGSLNEGVWPKIDANDPFMSNSMKRDFGLPLPEQNIGISADDLSALMNAKEVYLTRAERIEGTPTDKSRFWLRLETVFKAMKIKESDLSDVYFSKLVEALDYAPYQPVLPACPTPPVQARPRHFSATMLERLMKSPYDIFAGYILKLKKLNPVESVLDQRDFGTLTHKILERFCLKYDADLDENAKDELQKIAEEELQKYALNESQKVFWKNQISKITDWVLNAEKESRKDIRKILTEVHGQIAFEGPLGPVTFSATADRLEETKDGCYHIADYKTASCPTKSDVASGYAPQLLLEALIAESGGFSKDFEKLKALPVKNVYYWKLLKEVSSMANKDLDLLLDQTKEHIQILIDTFDHPDTPYLFNPNPKHINTYSDYAHLARTKDAFDMKDDNE